MLSPNDPQSLVCHFQQFVQESDLSPRTKELYTRNSREFVLLVGDIALADVQRSHFVTFRSQEAVRGESWLKCHLDPWRSFFRWCQELGIPAMPPEQIKLPKYRAAKKLALSRAEIERLLKVGSLRDQAIVHLLFSTGCRLSELVSLDIADLDFSGCTLSVRTKGNKSQLKTFSRETSNVVRRYVASRQDSDPYLFRSKNNSRLGTRSVQRVIDKLSKISGLNKPITPHTIRRSCLSEFYRRTKDPLATRDKAGHASVITTEGYISLSTIDEQANTELLSLPMERFEVRTERDDLIAIVTVISDNQTLIGVIKSLIQIMPNRTAIQALTGFIAGLVYR